jgi:hypothetical protein
VSAQCSRPCTELCGGVGPGALPTAAMRVSSACPPCASCPACAWPASCGPTSRVPRAGNADRRIEPACVRGAATAFSLGWIWLRLAILRPLHCVPRRERIR